MKRIAIFGTGKPAEYYAAHHDFGQDQVEAFVEIKKSRETFHGKPVISVAELDNRYDEIHMANSYLETLDAVLAHGIPAEKIIFCNAVLFQQYLDRAEGEVSFPFRYNRREAEEYEKYVGIRVGRGFYILTVPPPHQPSFRLRRIFRPKNPKSLIPKRVCSRNASR